MKVTCMRCDRSAATGTLFCHDRDCPAERSPALLEAGDRVGDIRKIKG